MGLLKQKPMVEAPVVPWTGARWEYKFVEVGGRSPAKMEAQLNAAGTEGWELVGIAAPPKGQLGALSTSSLVGVLKRQIVTN